MGFTRWVNDYGQTKQSVYLVRPENCSIGDVVLRGGQSTFDYLWTCVPKYAI